jgi:CcmD family protein
MTGLVALKAAYTVTWIVPLLYLRYLLTRYRRVRNEMKDLKRSS